MAFSRDWMEHAEDLGALTETQKIVYATKQKQLQEAETKNSNDSYHKEFVEGFRNEIRLLLQKWYEQRQRT